MIDGIVRRGTLVTVCLLILCVVGLVAALRTPVQMIPDLDTRTISVRTGWAGASAQDVESEILIEQEEFLRNVPNLSRLTATASPGAARIRLDFPYDTDITAALLNVNNALNRVPSYPENVRRPRVFATSFSGNSFMFFRVTPQPGNPRGVDMDMIRDYVDDQVRTRMESVRGVSSVGLFGGGHRQVQIRVNPRALADRGLSLIQVRDALRARNRDVSGGDVDQGKRRYTLRTIGRFTEIESLKDLVIQREGDALIRLGDVATVRLDHAKKSYRNSVNGEPVLILPVRREAGSNVLQIKQDLLERMPIINRDVLNPVGMQLELTADDVGYVQASLDNVWTNLAIGAALATIVMFVFLRAGLPTLVGVVGIPICTIAAILGLYLSGRTINVISLAGVAFAIGMTLDNSIVVLESIDAKRRLGIEKMQAAIEGLRSVWPAVLASTATTVLVFLPVIFIQEEAGQLYSDVAIAICAAILVSMLVALTLVPSASAQLTKLGAIGTTNTGGASASGKPVATGETRVARMTAWLIRGTARPLISVLLITLICGLIFVVLTPPASYLPEGEEPKTFASMSAPSGYNLSTMSRFADEIEQHFLPYVANSDGPVQQNSEASAAGALDPQIPPIRYLIVLASAERVRIIAETVDPNRLGELMKALTRKYREYPGMRAFAARGSIITSNDGGTRSINVDVSGAKLTEVFSAAEAVFSRAREVFDNPRVRATPSTRSLSQPMVEVRPNWDRAAQVGLSAADIGFTVSVISDGAYIDEFFRGDDKIDIYMYGQSDSANAVGGDAATRLNDITQIQLISPQGVVPLSSVADIVETVATGSIRRVDGQRTVTVNIIPPEDVALEAGVARVRTDLVKYLRDTGKLGAGININISGASDQLNATKASLLKNYAIAVVIVYLLLVAILVHWGYPLLIMATIPLGMAGGIIGLLMLNTIGGWLPYVGLAAVSQPFDMISMLGFLILMGTVVNNPILVVIRMMENIRDRAMSINAAVTDAVNSRVRPIAMTTITTLCGLAPLVFWGGEGTELYRGVGAIVMAGLLGSAIVSVTFLPALSVLVLRRVHRNASAAPSVHVAR
jgi:multidrug efflux pump subunit AcrB